MMSKIGQHPPKKKTRIKNQHLKITVFPNLHPSSQITKQQLPKTSQPTELLLIKDVVATTHTSHEHAYYWAKRNPGLGGKMKEVYETKKSPNRFCWMTRVDNKKTKQQTKPRPVAYHMGGGGGKMKEFFASPKGRNYPPPPPTTNKK